MRKIELGYSSNLEPHYSAAIIYNGLVFVSGQLAIDNNTGKIVSGGIREHTKQALSNLNDILVRSGTDAAHVLQCRIYTSDLALWGEINAVYQSFFGNHKPARVIVPTLELHYGSLIEIEAIAYTEEKEHEICM